MTHPSELRWSQLQAIAVGGAGLQAFYRRVSPLHRLETGVQSIQLSPYRAGLAEPALQRFRTVAAFPTCYSPPWLSPFGGSGDPGTFSELLPIESGILCRVTRRTAAIQNCAPPCIKGVSITGERSSHLTASQPLPPVTQYRGLWLHQPIVSATPAWRPRGPQERALQAPGELCGRQLR